MRNLWTDAEANEFPGDLGLRVYSSRLLGREKRLVLHGGGNTSVKVIRKDIFGQEEDILYVKGSGWDLETIGEKGFSPVSLNHAIRLASLPSLSDPAMVNELRTHMLEAAAPTPSVEAIMHAVIPYKYVDHTHADAILSITDTQKGEDFLREIYGDRVVYIPYAMPGFDLARLVAAEFPRQAHSGTQGMILFKHGVFSFGATAKESYERMIALVGEAEDFLETKNASENVFSFDMAPMSDIAPILDLRRDICALAGMNLILSTHRTEKTLAFANQKDMTVTQRGPATPDHIIRTKRNPALNRDLQAFSAAYRKYFEDNSVRAKQPKKILDTAPRLILDRELGLLCAGRRAQDALIAAEIYDHTIDIVSRAEKLDKYQPLDEQDLFDMEYWDLEQAKLVKPGNPPIFEGQIALVTGAASGIGKACVAEFLASGAAVVGLDRSDKITEIFSRPDYLGICCDLTDETAVREAFVKAALAFGGVDMLILNAGVFPPGKSIAEMDMDYWTRVMNINLNANVTVMRQAHVFLKKSPAGGRVVAIGSKNLAAPGPNVSAYSVSKAAVNQLMRVAVLEWASDGIRINSIHPNSVFDTGIWSAEVIQSRAKSYNLTPEAYRKNNLLKIEVTSPDVARMAVTMCSPVFSRTTGSGIPVDGGVERVV